MVWEIIESFFELDLNWIAVGITLIISIILWGVIWFTPWWQNVGAFGFKEKFIISLVFPIVGYILAARQMNN